MEAMPLFEAGTRYEAGADPVGPSDGRRFPYLGSDGGRVAGPQIEGTLRWSCDTATGQGELRAFALDDEE
jgi:hypothetical protein